MGDGEQGRDKDFTAYASSRMPAMRSFAFLLCGDWSSADDLVQTAFLRLYRAWARAAKVEQLDAYTRRIIVRVFLDERRRPWRRERVTAVLPETAAAELPLVDQLVIRAALAAVPPRQRAALVLRFYSDLPVEQIAEVLGCSPGTVKSQTARGLAALRRELERQDYAVGRR
jgi:RNA polymerase sigma-70 factor (sigma-E family)